MIIDGLYSIANEKNSCNLIHVIFNLLFFSFFPLCIYIYSCLCSWYSFKEEEVFLISFEQTLVECNDTNSSELNSLPIDFFSSHNRLSLLKLLMEVAHFNQSGNVMIDIERTERDKWKEEEI